MKFPPYLDLYSLSEDERIGMIGHRAIDHRETVAFIVENDFKADRYIRKLKANFPTIEVVERFPIESCIGVKVGPPVQ